MPRFAPLMKVAACRRLGANVILHGDSFMEARTEADKLAQREKLAYIHGYNEASIIAGQGTMALEILDQVPDVEVVVVPVGGGGLIAGVSLAIKSMRPDVRVVGVEAENTAGFTLALRNGRPVRSEMKPTLADGLAVGEVGDLAFSIARHHVDEVITVDEENLALAIFRLIELEKSVVEGAAAAPLAACVSGRLSALTAKRVVLCLTGGNIDLTILDRVIEHGLVTDGRLCRFTAMISDRPGGLAVLAGLIASTGASIKDIGHDRTFSGPDVTTVRAVCVVETTDHQHVEKLLRVICQAGIKVIPDSRDVSLNK